MKTFKLYGTWEDTNKYWNNKLYDCGSIKNNIENITDDEKKILCNINYKKLNNKIKKKYKKKI